MLDHPHPFPVTEVGLGQMGVLRRGRHEANTYGKLLREAARLFQGELELKAAPLKRTRRRRTLPPDAPDGKLKP